MKNPCCPICADSLELRDVSPCMECGGDPREIKHLQEGTHNYTEVRIFGAFPIVLCDFCQIDFGTYPSYFFGIPRKRHLGFNDIEFVRSAAPVLDQDWFCNSCGYRLSFLEFVAALRQHFSQQDEART